MTSNPAKPGFRLKSLWNALLKEEIYIGEIGLEDVRRELSDYSGTAVVNDTKSNYGNPPETVKGNKIDEYFEDLESYPFVEGYCEVFSDGQSYEVFVSLAPGEEKDEDLKLLESEGLKVEWVTEDEPDF